MRLFNKKIIFSKTPLKGRFNYRDRFQIFPLESAKAPKSPYADHFPLILEYYIDFDEYNNPQDIDIFDDLTAQQAVEFEITNLLTVLSNHRFFTYKSNRQWAIKLPYVKFKNLTHEEQYSYNNQKSSWTLNTYIYPESGKDLKIEKYSNPNINEIELVKPYYDYFTINPIEDKNSEIRFPETIKHCLDNYFSLNTETYKKIKSTIALICDGIDIIDIKRSLSFLAFVSAIESLISLEYSDKEIKFECNHCKAIKSSPFICQTCGRPIWGIKAKFKEFLKKFVVGGRKSEEKYNKIYNFRCSISHQGQLLKSDYDLSFEDMDKKEREWLMKLETLQLARLSLTNWLRYEKRPATNY